MSAQVAKIGGLHRHASGHSIGLTSMLRGAIVACICLVVPACANIPGPQERRATADRLAAARGWTATTLPAGAFDLAVWLPARIQPGAQLTVYIEGDGLAWLSSDTPSPDPTPVAPLGLRLALAQPEGNAAYLARPCQFATSRLCQQRYWTSHRFADEVIASTNLAVDALKTRFGAYQITLVGYSGGAAVAALLAQRRTDVVRLVTVAGNLDHQAWTAHHRISTLSGSLNAADDKSVLAMLPQWHFAGERDKIVPPFLIQSFAAGLPAAHVVTMEGYDHKCCWAENWPDLWKSVSDHGSKEQ